MSRMIWVPDAVHRYYLQEVKRRSSVMRTRPVNPNLPDSKLISIYKDLISKDADELVELIDPQFKQLSRVEKLNEMLVADDQRDKTPDYREVAYYSETTNDSETAEEIDSMDSHMFASVQFPNEIVNQLMINSTAEFNTAPSCKITEMQSQEELDITFEILQEIITREAEEDKKVKEEKEREEKENEEQESEEKTQEEREDQEREDQEEEQETEEQETEVEEQETNNYQAKYVAEENIPGYVIIEFEIPAQDILEQLMQQQLLNQEFLQQVAVKEEPMEEDIMQLEPMEQDLIELEQMNEADVTEEPMNEVIVWEEPTNEVIVLEEPMNEVIITEEPMNEVIITEEPMNEVVVLEEPANDVIIIDEPMKEVIVLEEPMNQVFIIDEDRNEMVVMEEAPNPAAPNPAPNAVPQPVPQRVNRRKQKHVLMEQAINNREIEVIRDGVTNKILLDVRPSAWPKLRQLKTYERKRKQTGPIADTRLDKQSEDKSTP